MLDEFQVRGKKVVALRSSPASPRVLLLHGAGGNHHSFSELVAQLGVEYIVPALPGRCGSEGPAIASVSELALWLSDFMRAASLGPIVICGHSFGGAIAIEFAVLREQGATNQVNGLVLLATGARLRVSPQILEAMERAVEKNQPASIGPANFSVDTSNKVIREHEENLRQTPPATSLSDWRASDQFDRMAEISTIQLPTLVLSAENDRLTPPKFASFLHAQLPSSTHIEIGGSGHMFPIEKAKECANEIRQFIAPLFASEND
jgi:pimeloyl-ACP methyl ester carboxylesterase